MCSIIRLVVGLHIYLIYCAKVASFGLNIKLGSVESLN